MEERGMWLLLIFLGVVGSEPDCDRTVLKGIMMCIAAEGGADLDALTAELNGEDPETVVDNFPVVGEASADMVDDACRNGTYISMLECMRDQFKQDCDTEYTRFFRQRLLNVNEVIDSISFICKHTDVYRKSEPCLQRFSGEIRECYRRSEAITHQAISVAGSDTDRQERGFCSGSKAGALCVDRIIRKPCGKEIADIVYHSNHVAGCQGASGLQLSRPLTLLSLLVAAVLGFTQR